MDLMDTLKGAVDFAKNLPCLVAGLFEEDGVLMSKRGYVGGKDFKSVVTLFGNKDGENFSDLLLKVVSPTNTFEISPKVNFGKKPAVNLFRFDSSGAEQIFYCVETSDETCYCAVFAVEENQLKTVFDSDIFVAELGFELLIKSKIKSLLGSISAPDDNASSKAKVKSMSASPKAKKPSQAVLRPVMAVFPYFNPFNNCFSLQLWQKTDKKTEGIDGKIFCNLRYQNGCFCLAFQGICQN